MPYEMFIIQITTLGVLFLFTSALNLLVLWYLAGLYLILLGLLLLVNDGDILVGFLWVIDLGVGLIFFIFILHYSAFLHQKSTINKNSREITLALTFLLAAFNFFMLSLSPVDQVTTNESMKSWLFLVNWVDYYSVFTNHSLTDLNLLREIYFVNNSLEFILINFFLFYGIVASILLSFLIKYVFTKLSLPQFFNFHLTSHINSLFFIKDQNFLKQNSTSAGERVWVKKRFSNFNS